MIELSVVIVTFNSAKTIVDCLSSIIQADSNSQIEIIVVDNVSQDGTPALIREQFPNVRLIENRENIGFGAGNNIGVARATGRYLALINPDLSVHQDTLAILINCLKQDSSIGMVGPRTYAPTGTVQMTARPPYTLLHILITYWHLRWLSSQLTYGAYHAINHHADQPTDAAWLQGSCLLMARSLYQAIGGFDEEYFLYMEDVDLSEQVLSTGKRVVYCPDASATHIGGASTGGEPLLRVRGYHISPLYHFGKNKGEQASSS